MSAPKVVTLRARPWQVSHLCFAVSGIIDAVAQIRLYKQKAFRPIQLGDSATKFPFDTFYKGLSATPAADSSRLTYDSDGILNDATVQVSLLMTLRAESTKAILDKAVNARQNAYYAKYANQGQIIAVMEQFYKATNLPGAGFPNPVSKPDMLGVLRNVAQAQADNLLEAYSTTPLSGVVTETSSILQTSYNPDMTQTITNTGYSYRTPALETNAHNLRAQISLIDQQFAQFMASQNLPNLEQVFKNERQSLDLDVKRLQIAYLNTILMSPINGIVTGIYKNSGDSVSAGEPVIRVEDNSSVILVATLAYQGSISVGQTMTVTTSLFDASSAPPIVGNIIAVRGRRNEDDLWEVHAICDNFSAPVLPINYHFDHDDTSVTIS